MNAEVYNTNATQAFAGDVRNNSIPDRLLLPGFLMSESGIILIAMGHWVQLDTMTQTLLLISGAILCLFGIVLIPSWLIYRMQAASGAQATEEDHSA
jgi:hypothetical protein